MDLALNTVEIMDRNLYERSCDVRWWATDAAVVECCTEGTEAASAHASKRLGVILSSYTVYLDLWVADRTGRVIANGRLDRYPNVIGSSVAAEPWFLDAMQTRDGSEFAVMDIVKNPALQDAQVATYGAAVRRGGLPNGEPIGALGAFFDWQPQARTVVTSGHLREQDGEQTRCMLVDSELRIIATSAEQEATLTERYSLISADGRSMGYYNDCAGRLVGYARTPGYETYQGLGWYGVVEQSRPGETSHPGAAGP
jgi:hypothetical protein